MRRLPRALLALLVSAALATAAGASWAAAQTSSGSAQTGSADTQTDPAGAASSTPAPFAALTVTPDGPQSYDISTGVTTLPDGGTVVDKDSGVSLKAGSITYLDGAYIDAQSVTVSGAFGTLRADKVHIDVKTGVLTAGGDLGLTRGGLTLTAAKLSYDADRAVADFSGAVTGTSPDFQADRLLLDADSGNVLLLGDYRYASGPFTLRAPEGGGRLELELHQVDGMPVYDAATEISPELLARFAAELH